MRKSSRSSAFATRLFLALFILSAVPSLVLLGAGTWALSHYVELTGSLGAWGRVAETGQALLREVERQAPRDSEVARAAESHREELSRSVALSRRFDLLGRQLARLLPLIALALGLLLGACSLWAARRLAAGLSKPVAELVGWVDLLARGQELPRRAGEERGAREIRALRSAFRDMAARLAEGRARALEAERLRAWTELARRVAHELKNSLTPIRLAVFRLEKALAAGGDRGASGEAIRVIAEESERLEDMARSFAQLGRMPEGPRTEIDLASLLADLAAVHAPGRAKVEVAVPRDLPRIHGFYDALSRVFRNLLVNALDATEGRPRAEVRVWAERSDSAVSVHVADSGPGIDPAVLERIWEPDFTTKSRGTGLGLALVRQAVRAHGGDVEARNRPEGGAEFIVHLPVAATPAPEAAAPGLKT